MSEDTKIGEVLSRVLTIIDNEIELVQEAVWEWQGTSGEASYKMSLHTLNRVRAQIMEEAK